jgi:hypothetical protein
LTAFPGKIPEKRSDTVLKSWDALNYSMADTRRLLPEVSRQGLWILLESLRTRFPRQRYHPHSQVPRSRYYPRTPRQEL